MSINYEVLTEITVKNQSELDMIPSDFKGRIYIEFGDIWNPAIVTNKYYNSVVAWGNSHVVAKENSHVEAWENSHVEARENSHVEARENSHVVAWENSSVAAWGNSHVVAKENSHVEAWENSHVEARENSSVAAWGNSHVEAWENSHVEAWENSHVEARENSSVDGNGNAQIVDRLSSGRIEITGNARIVYVPKTIMEYCDFYGLKHDKKVGRFYKCVHKVNGKYISDYIRNFEYIIGEKVVPDAFDPDTREDCGHGIHVAHLSWVLDYGRNWDDLAIIEVESNLKDIVVPNSGNGKVRCKEVTVIREVPLEECGLYGKMLAKRIKN